LNLNCGGTGVGSRPEVLVSCRSVRADVAIVSLLGNKERLPCSFHFIEVRVSQDVMYVAVDSDRTVECARRRRRTQHATFMLVISSDMLLVSHAMLVRRL
jgi:hypothetical protein